MGVAAMANLAYAAETADKAAATETVAAAYTDGEYTAEGKGIGGKVPVTVEVKDGKVATVTVGDNSETQGIGSKAIEQLPPRSSRPTASRASTPSPPPPSPPRPSSPLSTRSSTRPRPSSTLCSTTHFN
ncbi:MAG: FMN-binding protein [Coriobacteriales bacterium]|nr:FMN-binding protein [Coriobacteriales bacterium]